MHVDPTKFLICNEIQIVFGVNPREKETKGLQEPKLDWLEALKAMNNGIYSEKLDQDVKWVGKYKKLFL